MHAGILAMRDNAAHMKQLKTLGIAPIDVVAINLYPFKQTIQKPGVTLEEAIVNIDIGGPTMIRAAAKKLADVAVVVDPPTILPSCRASEREGFQRGTLSARCKGVHPYSGLRRDDFGLSAPKNGGGVSRHLTLTFEKAQDMRYGENPHQKAAFYREIRRSLERALRAKQLHGKELSYNNINDANARSTRSKSSGPKRPARWPSSTQSLRRGCRRHDSGSLCAGF